MLMHGAVQSQGGAHSHFDDPLVEDREGAGEAQADRAGISVGGVTEAGGAGAEDLGIGEQLDVNFQADNRLIFGQDFGRESGRIWREFRHTRIGNYSTRFKDQMAMGRTRERGTPTPGVLRMCGKDKTYRGVCAGTKPNVAERFGGG